MTNGEASEETVTLFNSWEIGSCFFFLAFFSFFLFYLELSAAWDLPPPKASVAGQISSAASPSPWVAFLLIKPEVQPNVAFTF